LLLFLSLSGFLSACGVDTAFLDLRYDTGGTATSVPDLILLVSMSPDGSDFKISARFCDQVDSQGRCTQFRDFIGVTSTQQALLGCATFMGYISNEDKQSAPFQGLTATRAACATSLNAALKSVLPGGAGTELPVDPLAANGMNLINNKDGHVFMISMHDVTTSNPCFQVAAVKVQDGQFQSPLTAQVSNTSFLFAVSDVAGGAGDSGDTARGKCFRYTESM
jgi:hypothetical protein